MEGEGKLKASRRENLESLARQGDIEAQYELDNLPELPMLASHLWIWWRDLHETRSSNGMGASRLTRLEIQAWERDGFRNLLPWERQSILEVDAAWVRSVTDPEA